MNEDVFVLLFGKSPNSMVIYGIYSTLETARAAAVDFIPWPRGWFNNELISLTPGWETVRIEQWAVLDAVPMVGADD
jgi:hypothetical protein